MLFRRVFEFPIPRASDHEMLMRRTRPDEEIVNVRLAIPDEYGVNAGL